MCTLVLDAYHAVFIAMNIITEAILKLRHLKIKCPKIFNILISREKLSHTILEEENIAVTVSGLRLQIKPPAINLRVKLITFG